MAQLKSLVDEYGIIYTAEKDLPNDPLKIAFLEALAELENNENHRKGTFPKTQLRKVQGVRQAVYRADIMKKPAWRIHVQRFNKRLHLKDILPPKKHNQVTNSIKAKKHRYD